MSDGSTEHCGGHCGACDDKHRNWEEALELAQAALGTAESLVRDLANLLKCYRLEHSQNNCYYSWPTGAICDECEATDAALSKIPKEMTSHD
jgi:hypothetical protein